MSPWTMLSIDFLVLCLFVCLAVVLIGRSGRR